MSDKITLTHELASAVRVASIFDRDAPHSWVFLGGDYTRLRAWEKALGAQFIRIDISRLLAEASSCLRAVYVEWTDQSSRRYGKDTDWWFTNIAERNPMASPLFLHTCYLYIVRTMCQAQMEKPELIVMESWGLLRSMCLLLRAEGLSFRVVGRWKAILNIVRRPLVFLYGWVQFCRVVARGHLAAVRTGSARRVGIDRDTSKPVAIIDTFVHEDSLSNDRIFCDRYFPALHEWLERQGWDVWVLPTLYDIHRPLRDVFSELRRDRKKFIIREDWLTLSDALSALRCSIKALFYPRRAGSIADLDVGYLVREECWRQASSAGTMHAKLLARLPLRLASTDLNPALVIDWFENQKIDKALALGFRKAFPAVTIVGAQCFVPLPDYLGCFPTKAEWEFGISPDKIVCCGRHQAKVIKMFGSEVPLVTGAALRFQYLYLLGDRRQKSLSGGEKSRNVLITLPSRVSEAVELLDTVRPVIERHNEVAHWYLKCHPDYLVNKVDLAKVYGGGKWSERIEIWTAGLDKGLEIADVVISTGSGTAIEAACLEIPVIVVGRQTGLTYNPMAWFEGVDQVCYSAEEVDRQLSAFFELGAEGRKRLRERGKRLREACYEPLTDESLRPYLGGLDASALTRGDGKS